MKHIKERSEFLNELKNSYSKFKVGEIYNHPKFGKFEVIELARDSKTKVRFLEGSSKGDISYIAGWGDDGYVKESVTNENTQYAVMLTGGSIGDTPRPRDAKGYIGMPSNTEDLYTKEKAKEKADRMNKTVLSPGERKYYRLKYVIVPVKDGKFIKESLLNDENKLVNERWKPLGLSIEETEKVAKDLAAALAKVDGVKFEITKGSLEPDAFDLDRDGVKWDGGSYTIHDDKTIVNNSYPGGPVYGKVGDSIDKMVKTIKSVFESFTNESKLNLGLSTNNYPAGTIGRYRIESTVINLRKVADLSKDSWKKYSRAFGDNELGFEKSNDRKEALAAIQKSFDNGQNDLREFSLNESSNMVTRTHNKYKTQNVEWDEIQPGDYIADGPNVGEISKVINNTRKGFTLKRVWNNVRKKDGEEFFVPHDLDAMKDYPNSIIKIVNYVDEAYS